MEDFQMASALDALDTVTGVRVERVETDRTYFTARGFDITNFQYDGASAPFANGLLLGDLDTALFDRVEVVRGANGLTSATGYPSATVNLVRKRPTRELQASAALGAGSWGRARADVDLSGPLSAGGSVRGRFVAAAEGGDSYLDRLSSRKHALYGVLEADLGASTRVTGGFLAQRKKTDGGLWGALPLAYTDGSPTAYARSTSTAADWVRWDNRDAQGFLELAHTLAPGWTFKATWTRRKQEGDDKLFYVYGTPDRATGLGLYAYPSLYAGTTTQDALDASLKGEFSLFGRTHALVLGAQHATADVEDVSHYGRGIGTPLPDLATWDGRYPEPLFDASVDGGSVHDTRTTGYAAARFSLAEGAGLLVGAAWTRQRTRGLAYGVDRYRSDGRATPYLGLTWEAAPAHTLYASYAEIFNPQSEVDRAQRRLEPVRGGSLEAGLKSSWLGGRVQTTFAAFRTTQSNLAESDGYVGIQAVYKGVDTVSRGLEAEVAGDVTRDLQVNAGATILKLENAGGGEARTFIPRRTVQAGATWRLPFLPKAKVGANVAWKSAIRREEGPGITLRQEACALVNLMAKYDFTPSLSGAVNVENATDEKYLTSLYWSQGFYGAPANMRVSLSWRY
ncbi:MAG TPA: TonB-dependent siderophore receptor, partial [Holophaga sp.]|nr:TonB-dependent siderophore receptor [Holophaga sp.]